MFVYQYVPKVKSFDKHGAANGKPYSFGARRDISQACYNVTISPTKIEDKHNRPLSLPLNGKSIKMDGIMKMMTGSVPPTI